METRFRGEEGAGPLSPGPRVSHPELLGPFIPPPSPGAPKGYFLHLRPNSWYQCLLSPILLSCAMDLVLPHNPSVESLIFVRWIHSLSIYKEWRWSQLKTICYVCVLLHLQSVKSWANTKNLGTSEEEWWTCFLIWDCLIHFWCANIGD